MSTHFFALERGDSADMTDAYVNRPSDQSHALSTVLAFREGASLTVSAVGVVHALFAQFAFINQSVSACRGQPNGQTVVHSGVPLT